VPIPKPNSGESQSDFISRCAKFLAESEPGRDQKQRVAICYSTYRRAEGVKATEVEMPDLKIATFSKESEFQKVDLKLTTTRLWRKEVLRFGKWIHPTDKDITFDITPEVAAQIVNNFNAGVPEVAPVVLTHTDNPLAKVGVVKSFIVTKTGLDAVFPVEDAKLNENIENKDTQPGVSVWLDMNYQHKETGEKIGAVVKHVAIVNHPYIEGMKSFEAVLTEAGAEGKDFLPLILSEDKKDNKGKTMPLDLIKVKTFLRDEHQIDVDALLSDSKTLKQTQERIDNGELVTKDDLHVLLGEELSKTLREKLELSADTKIDVVAVLTKLLTGDKKKEDTQLTEFKELKKENTALKERLDKADAEKAVSVLLTEGFLFPTEQEHYEKLYLSDRALYDGMVTSRKKTGKVVELSEDGSIGGDDDEEDADKVIARNREAGQKEGLIAKAE
jgi:hypothetical protein